MIEHLSEYAALPQDEQEAKGIQLSLYKEEWIAEFEAFYGAKLPDEYRAFIKDYGTGFLLASWDGSKRTETFDNALLDPDEIRDILENDEEKYGLIGVEFAEGDMPVFDLGSRSYFVMRPKGPHPNAVYRGWASDDQPLCPSFNAFIGHLLENPEFYLKDEFQPKG